MKRTPLARTKPLRPRSRRKAADDREWADTKAEVLERAEGRCQHPDGCPERAVDVHHRAGRTGRLMHDKRYLIALCRPHHHRAHLHPAESYASGLMLPRHGLASPWANPQGQLDGET